MKVLDILNAPWAIQPQMLLEIQSIYATHLRGDKVDLAAVEKKLGRPLDNEPKAYDIQDGVAVLPVEGVIAKRMNLFSQISGGTSTELLGRDLRAALADPQVHSVILAVDSPGGTVDGTQALADAIFAARGGAKPIVALANGTMASAAYWLGSAASRVYIADGTTVVGSIGVVASHTDISEAEKMRGIKTTEIAAGKYKRIASQHGPLSKEGRQTIQDQVDYTYSLFVGAVARNMGVSEDTVLADMADGRVFIGQQAIDAGLVDGIETLGAVVQQLNALHLTGQRLPSSRKALAAAPVNPSPSNPGASTMELTAELVASEHPEIAAHFRAQGASAEQARIAAVEAQLIPGHEALIASLKADGKTTGAEAAMQVLAAERAVRSSHAARLAADAPAAVPQKPGATVLPNEAAQTAADQAAQDALPVEERCAARWASDPKIRAEFATLADFTAMAKAEATGKVRILSRTRAA